MTRAGGRNCGPVRIGRWAAASGTGPGRRVLRAPLRPRVGPNRALGSGVGLRVGSPNSPGPASPAGRSGSGAAWRRRAPGRVAEFSGPRFARGSVRVGRCLAASGSGSGRRVLRAPLRPRVGPGRALGSGVGLRVGSPNSPGPASPAGRSGSGAAWRRRAPGRVAEFSGPRFARGSVRVGRCLAASGSGSGRRILRAPLRPRVGPGRALLGGVGLRVGSPSSPGPASPAGRSGSGAGQRRRAPGRVAEFSGPRFARTSTAAPGMSIRSRAGRADPRGSRRDCPYRRSG